MDCREVREKWANYFMGNMSIAEQQRVEKHINSCPDCKKRFEEDIYEDEMDTVSYFNIREEGKGNVEGQGENERESSGETQVKESAVGDLDEDVPLKKQQRIMWRAKWRNRISNAFTLLSLFILISIFTAIFTGLYYGLGGEEGRARTAANVVSVATQMTMPNVYVNGVSSHTGFYFTLNLDGTLHKSMGKDHKAIGQLEGNMLFNLLSVDRDWNDGQYNVELYFMHPEMMEMDEMNTDWTESTWETLDILPEGTVAEMAVSFDDVYEFEEIYNIFSGYDLEIVWYGVDTGVEGTSSEYRSPYLSASGGILGIHERGMFDLMAPNSSKSIKVMGDGEKKQNLFKKGLEFLIDNENLVKRYVWSLDRHGASLSERLEYVEEHGVRSYGVVVTGPTKELLTLQDVSEIQFATIGEVTLWNWYNRNAGGTIFN
ncbi:anti sigma factor C-terminal domain-containing protein [Litchfieldia alkalitelluris]|nr:anti sigma factor C-terminal domain-containing protein [Litchfieldia alkalitelluris]